MIQLDNVHVALKGFDLTIDELHIPKGFTVGCIGRNGAGKSTLIRTMMGLTVPARGDVLWDGAPLDVAMKERIGFVYDDLYYPKEFKVKALRRLFRSVYPTWNDSLYTELLESYGVSEKKKIKQLSKGMKMKTQIALALAHDPDVLIMDEPTAGLDPVVRRQFVATLRDWMDAREDRTLFFSTHITSDLERFADYILLVDDGRVKFFLPIDEVEERFVLVRGTTNTLSERDQAMFEGVEWRGSQFTGLIDRSTHPIADDWIVERASLEDILYFLTEVTHDEARIID